MKLRFWIALIIMAIVIAVFCGLLLQADKVDMKPVKEADVCFQYGDINIYQNLNDKEVEVLKTIFQDKRMYKDNPSCGFSEAISIKFDNNITFCIAQDACPIVYWKEKDRYIKLSENEKTQLYNLLKSYGFFFPCV